ncbi:tyrosine-type recombinase/integrase [Yimella sp. NH-Cas1]|uniref:tyrosine-type recombinase/integrase n=1 Tax=Yimella sp. NH-Cas1 TaxID=2917726 RepID=UPI001EFC0B8C|nr:tyrosine-type recombinase/integrase [Yimella sp. NH-Cas1]MCG8655025.1 tyrosine-type recombinase/integrase [Yimella sp. NH-Cas1]
MTHAQRRRAGKARVVGLPAWLVGDLRVYLAQHPRSGDADAPLFPGRVMGGQDRSTGAKGRITYDQPWERDAFYRRHFKPALKAANLPQTMRLHDLRHTAGSLMLRAEIEPYRVAEYLGHSLDVLLKIYAHILEGDRAADMELLARPQRTLQRI